MIAELLKYSFVLLKVGIIGYMLYCIATSRNILCKITAALVICAKAAQLLLAFRIFMGSPELVAYLSNASLAAYILFSVSLFITASRASKKREEGAIYYYIIGASLLLIAAVIAFSLNAALSGGGYADEGWFKRLYVWKWPHIACALTFLVMRIKKVSLNKDEDKLLWYFAIASAIAIIFSFVI